MFTVLLRALLFLLAAMQPFTAAWASIDFRSITIDNGVRIIVASGEFEFTDDYEELRTLVSAGRPDFVIFDSPGGNVVAAMALGRLIRALELDTFQSKQLECSSACALAFLGGVGRSAMPGSIGVHQFFFHEVGSGREDAVADTQELTADILQYLDEMGVDPGLMQLALRYSRNDIRYLSASEMGRLHVTSIGSGLGDKLALHRRKQTPFPQQPLPLPKTRPSAPPKSADSIEWRASEFVKKVIDAHTKSENRALHWISSMYSESVSYFGKNERLTDVLADKRKYFRRWPERSYRIQDDTLSVKCDTAHCEVNGVYAWSVRSLQRNKFASGNATFSFVVDFSKSPRITYENSKVLSR